MQWSLQAVAPGMAKRRSGRIVVVGSITAFLASPFNGAYSVHFISPLLLEHIGLWRYCISDAQNLQTLSGPNLTVHVSLTIGPSWWHVRRFKRQHLLQASKAAVHAFAETLSMELQPFNVEVMEVWAGTFKTDINAKASSRLDRWASHKKLLTSCVQLKAFPLSL